MKFTVGQKVRALKTLGEGPSEELPAQHFCNRGDILEIRDVHPRWEMPFKVAHLHKPAGMGFLVRETEIEPLE